MTLPDGWTIRPVELVNGDGPDVDRALGVITKSESPLGMPTEETRESVRSYLDGPDCDRGHTVLVLDEIGTARGLLLVEIDAHSNEVSIDAYCDPDADLMAVLVRRGVARGHEVAAERGGSWRVRSGHYAQDARSDEALTAAGFSVVRHFLRMRVDFASTPPTPVPPWPDGVTLELAATPGTAPVAHAVLEDAFTDHWNHTARPFDDWWHHASSPPEQHDPSLWWLVRVDGEPAALLIGTLSRVHEQDGYVRALAVRRPFRGRGLARTLLLRHFEESRARGLRGVQLGVDATNPTGAVRLYESVGMRPVRHIVARELTVSGSG